MNLAKLRAELDGGTYSTDDATAADELNAVSTTRLKAIPSTELLAWSAGNGRLAKLKKNGMAHISEEVQAMSEAAYLMISRDGTSFDLSLLDRMAMLDALVATGVLDAADKNSLITLGTVPCSKAESLGLGTVTPSHVADARRL